MRLSGSESAGIWVGNRLAARVQLTPEDPVLTYTDDWKASGFALSPALPLTGPADSRAVTAFFENMLPESRAFENLVLATQISAGNKIGLVLKLGYDLPGAMRLTADTSGEVREAIRPVTAAEITSRIEAPDTHPMDLWDNRPRVTVAGAQPKLNLLMTDGRYVLAEGSTIASDRILKFEPKGSPFLAINEFLSLELARALGHPVAQARLFRMGEHRVLEVFRFDRKTELRAGKKRVWRRHVIDACQALGLTSAYKYERPFGDSRDVAAIRTGVSLVRLFLSCGLLIPHFGHGRLRPFWTGCFLTPSSATPMRTVRLSVSLSVKTAYRTHLGMTSSPCCRLTASATVLRWPQGMIVSRQRRARRPAHRRNNRDQ